MSGRPPRAPVVPWPGRRVARLAGPAALIGLALGMVLATAARRGGAPVVAAPDASLAQAAAPSPPELFFAGLRGGPHRAEVQVQGLSGRDSGVMLVVLAPGSEDCDEDAPAPLAVHCLSAAPGVAVHFPSTLFTAGLASAAAFSLTTDGGVGGVPQGGSAFAEACRLGRENLLRRPAEYAAFKRSFEGEGSWKGVRWSEAWGGPLTGQAAWRHRPHGDVELGRSVVQASAAAPRGSNGPAEPLDLGAAQAITVGTATFALPYPAPSSPAITPSYTVLNAANECVTIRASFRWPGSAATRRTPLCGDRSFVTIPPGATVPLCLMAPPGEASLVLEATTPSELPRLAVTVELMGPETVRGGYGGDLPAGDHLALPMPFPLGEGWRARVQLVNPSVAPAWVEVTWEEDGVTLRRQVVPLASLESRTVDMGGPPSPPLPAQGAIHARSTFQSPPAGADAAGPPVGAVLELSGATDTGRQGLLTNLLAEPLAVVGGEPGAGSDGLLGLPLLQRGAEGDSEASVLDATVGEGVTDLRLVLSDANGFVDMDCATVAHGDVHRWDLRGLGTLPTGYRGSGIISAESREPAGPRPEVPDLIASVALRSRAGEVAVDASAETVAGIASVSADGSVLPPLPPCPGVPTRPPSTVPTLTPTDLPTATATPSPTDPAPARGNRVLLPALAVLTDPKPLGLVLVLDILPGGARRARADAIPLPIARNLGLAALESLRPRVDSAALVQFGDAAKLAALGRPADVAVVLRDLAAADLEATGRPDLGLAAADLAARELRATAGAQSTAVLLFVDGTTETVYFERAAYRAGILREGGSAVYALGFQSGADQAFDLSRLTGDADRARWIDENDAELEVAGAAIGRWASEGWHEPAPLPGGSPTPVDTSLRIFIPSIWRAARR